MIKIEAEGIRELEKALGGFAKKVPPKLSKAINETSKYVAKQMSIKIRSRLLVRATALNSVLKVKPRSTAKTLSSKVNLDEQKRLPLGEFGGKQIKKGVSYKISTQKGTQRIHGAFMGPRPGVKAAKLGNTAHRRVGKARYPKIKLMGASPWGAYVTNKMEPKTVSEAKVRLQKEIQREIREAELIKAGVIKPRGRSTK